MGLTNRVNRVLGILSLRRIESPHGSMGGDTLACGGGGELWAHGGPNYDEGTDTLVLYV
jgi:hypothetical protein